MDRIFPGFGSLAFQCSSGHYVVEHPSKHMDTFVCHTFHSVIHLCFAGSIFTCCFPEMIPWFGLFCDNDCTQSPLTSWNPDFNSLQLFYLLGLSTRWIPQKIKKAYVYMTMIYTIKFFLCDLKSFVYNIIKRIPGHTSPQKQQKTLIFKRCMSGQ